MKYKVGDKVRIKSLEWYKENRGISGDIVIGNTFFRDFMSRFCGSVVTIESIALVANLICYKIKEDGGQFCWVDEMIEELVEDVNVSEFKHTQDEIMKMLLQGALNIPEGYCLRDQDGNIINAKYVTLEKKKKKYPKTYEECSKIAPMTWGGVNFKHYNELLSSFCKLLICRDAYWKIAGEEMGLGKPWKPDWTNINEVKFIIGVSENEIIKCCNIIAQHVLAFPTAEMRDAFKKNFDTDIEICKEFLYGKEESNSRI